MSLGYKVYRFLAILSLFICVAAPLRMFFGLPTHNYQRDFEIYRSWLNGATLMWFLTAPVWLIPKLFHPKSEKPGSEEKPV